MLEGGALKYKHNALSRVLSGLLVSIYLKTLESIKMPSAPIFTFLISGFCGSDGKDKGWPTQMGINVPLAQRRAASDVE